MRLLILLLSIISLVYGHGYLIDPPARSSAWRVDPRFTKPYYQDMEMSCGGINVQWQQNGGKCGICGENYVKPKMFEKGGSHYTGQVVATYRKGHTMNVNIEVSTNHLGWFEFRICNVDGMSSDATQDCLDKTLLKDEQGNTRFPVGGTEGEITKRYKKLVLPANLTCNHCVFQWKYHTGHKHGTDPVTGQYCYGCGPVQEQFYGCSDVSILNF